MCSPAPEYLLDKTCDPMSDVFSLGCLTYALFYDGKSPVACGQDLKVYKAKLEKLPTLDIEKLPATCRGFLIPSIKLRANIILMSCFRVCATELFQKSVARSVANRLSSLQFQQSPYFDSILMHTVKYLDLIAEKTQANKSQFFKGLVNVLSQFPKRVIIRKVLPVLLDELKDHQLIAYVLPNIFWIAETMTNDEFASKIFPGLKPVFAVRDPPQVLIFIMENMDLLLKKTPSDGVRDCEFPNPIIGASYSFSFSCLGKMQNNLCSHSFDASHLRRAGGAQPKGSTQGAKNYPYYFGCDRLRHRQDSPVSKARGIFF